MLFHHKTLIFAVINRSKRHMILDKLSILNYRNIEELNVEWCDGVNCLIGRNGVGKSNILDAIHYLSFCRSSEV